MAPQLRWLVRRRCPRCGAPWVDAGAGSLGPICVVCDGSLQGRDFLGQAVLAGCERKRRPHSHRAGVPLRIAGRRPRPAVSSRDVSVHVPGAWQPPKGRNIAPFATPASSADSGWTRARLECPRSQNRQRIGLPCSEQAPLGAQGQEGRVQMAMGRCRVQAPAGLDGAWRFSPGLGASCPRCATVGTLGRAWARSSRSNLSRSRSASTASRSAPARSRSRSACLTR
jgi:hypothetical protein